MKRLIFIASLAMLAVGCQKTEIQNEVLTPIGFSTEVGKQTRAIVQDTEYKTDQPFAVYAYGHQGNAAATTVMDNVEVGYTDATIGENPTPAKWSATGDIKYYWPNDPNTKLDFYAYSPAAVTSPTAEKNHQKILTGTVSHTEKENDNDTDYGLKLTGYVHNNAYVDFMVAAPILEACYSDQDGTTGNETGLTSVPMAFGHKMTQVNFTVKIKDGESYPNVNFAINSITLNNIKCVADYSYLFETDNDDDTKAWTTTSQLASYRVYPATTLTNIGTDADPVNNMNDAPSLINADSETTEVAVVLETDAGTSVTKANPGRSFITTPVTMIPQDFDQSNPQSFTIVYTISGTGVATETVTKTFKFAEAATSAPAWGVNQKITYTLTISLNEITFAPSVVAWGTAMGDYLDSAPTNN